MTEGPDSPEQGDRDESLTEATASGQDRRELLRDEAQTESMPSAGQEMPDAMRGLQRAPRRVDIHREGGSYTIRFGGRNIASFCGEFSEITGYNIPENTHQQVYITVESLGEVRRNPVAAEEEFIRTRREQQDQEAQGAPSNLSEESLENLLARTRPDPPRRSDSIQTDAEGNIGWRATAIYHMEQEMITLRRMTDLMRTLP